MYISNLLQGIVVETKTKSWTGPYFYSDKIHWEHEIGHSAIESQPQLNELAKTSVIGIAAGAIRMILAIIHNTGHLLAAVVTFDKGHLVHIGKGSCEFLRGLIEAIPFAGRKFAREYNVSGEWWIIKIYNPDSPDSLDHYADNWRTLRQNRPDAYVVA